MKYFDSAATTKISNTALDSYIEASRLFYNPSALYGQAGVVQTELDKIRKNFLSKLKAPSKSNIIFTGCATESNNSVLKSCITRKDKKYLISAGEHSSVYQQANQLLQQGYNINFIPLKANGGVDEERLCEMLDSDVAFVSIIHVSNETGAVNDIESICKKIKDFNKNIIVHSDGVQALGKVEVNLTKLGVDYYTISAHKIYGPKGVGALYIKEPNKFKPFIVGGEQEFSLRAGTENYPGIVAFNSALNSLVINNFSEHKKAFLSQITEEHLLVSDDKCVDNIISICFAGVRGETIVHILEEQGYIIGTGSACNSKAKTNRVLSGIVDRKFIEGAVRISFGLDVSVNDCLGLGKAINEAVKVYKRKIR